MPAEPEIYTRLLDELHQRHVSLRLERDGLVAERGIEPELARQGVAHRVLREHRLRPGPHPRPPEPHRTHDPAAVGGGPVIRSLPQPCTKIPALHTHPRPH